MRMVFVILIVLHGLVHLMGFLKGFELVGLPQLKGIVYRTEGIFWLATAAAIVGAMALFIADVRWWWMLGLAGLIMSQSLIVLNWTDAKFGTIPNFILLVPVVVSMIGASPTGFRNVYRTEAQRGFNRLHHQPIMGEQDIVKLPAPVQRYLRYTGSIGKPRVQNFCAHIEGGLKNKANEDFMQMRVTQSNFFDEPTRAFYIMASKFGVPFEGLHLYKGNAATMQVKLLSLFKIVDGSGDTMTKSETVTMFNDMCMMAPATLIDDHIQWSTVNDHTVNARFTNAGNTISATLYFNDEGQLINFSSKDRYMSSDGKTYVNYEWTTPLKDYKDFRGRKIASYGEAIWHTPEGEFCYGKFKIMDIKYNCRDPD